MNNSFEAYVDGASSGNPGPSGIAVVIKKNNKILNKFSEYVGLKTNNQAEYLAIIKALKLLRGYGDSVRIFSDSQLVVKQLNGEYEVKSRNLKDLYRKVKELEKEFRDVKYLYIPRDLNIIADSLAKKSAGSKGGDIKSF